MLQTETRNRKAFELYNAAVSKVERYEASFDFSILDQALNDLESSIRADANYFRPANYLGIVYDLKGDSKKAVEEFNRIYPQAPEALKDEVGYNRAIANYHSYREPYILSAIDELNKVISSTKNLKISLLSKAALAQCYGMMVLHSGKKGIDQVQFFFEKTISMADTALALANTQNKNHDLGFLKYPRWISNNAKGIANMFYDDARRDDPLLHSETKMVDRLQTAKDFFEKALNYSPGNWALTCNLGSIDMRLGQHYIMLGKIDDAKAYFSKAERYLLDVIFKLRPNYDFAFYELGRIYRFQGNWDKATEYFLKADESGKISSSLSPSTIEREIKKAKDKNLAFN